MTLIGTGLLSTLTVSVFNSSTGNTSPILTTDVNIQLFDAATFNPTGTNTPFASFSGNVNFGTGLNPGFFTTVQFTGLQSLGIQIPTADIVFTQRLSNITGGSTRAGVVFFSQDNIGSQYLASDNHFRSNTVNGTGLFTIGANNNRMAFNLAIVAPEPGSLALGLLGLGVAGLALRRRHAA